MLQSMVVHAFQSIFVHTTLSMVVPSLLYMVEGKHEDHEKLWASKDILILSLFLSNCFVISSIANGSQ